MSLDDGGQGETRTCDQKRIGIEHSSAPLPLQYLVACEQNLSIIRVASQFMRIRIAACAPERTVPRLPRRSQVAACESAQLE